MAKVRQDAWSHEDDLLLAETVLRHVREGSTQLNAFEEVGDKLNRTSAACGFRWNAEVRKNYVDAMELAKRQRKEKKRAEARRLKQVSKVSTENTLPSSIPNHEQDQKQTTLSLSMNDVIQYLREIDKNNSYSHLTSQKLSEVEQENLMLKDHIEQLEKKLDRTENELKIVQEDYQTFIQIMERARKMTIFDDQNVKAPAFKMDKNGNLEQIAQSFNQ